MKCSLTLEAKVPQSFIDNWNGDDLADLNDDIDENLYLNNVFAQLPTTRYIDVDPFGPVTEITVTETEMIN